MRSPALLSLTLACLCILCSLTSAKKGAVIVINNMGPKGQSNGCMEPGSQGEGGQATTIVKTGRKGNTIIIKGGGGKKKEPIVKPVPIPIPIHVPIHSYEPGKHQPEWQESSPHQRISAPNDSGRKSPLSEMPVFVRDAAHNLANLFTIMPMNNLLGRMMNGHPEQQNKSPLEQSQPQSSVPMPVFAVNQNPSLDPVMQQQQQQIYVEHVLQQQRQMHQHQQQQPFQPPHHPQVLPANMESRSSHSHGSDQQLQASGPQPVIAAPAATPADARVEVHLPVFELEDRSASPAPDLQLAVPVAPDAETQEQFVSLPEFLSNIKRK